MADAEIHPHLTFKQRARLWLVSLDHREQIRLTRGLESPLKSPGRGPSRRHLLLSALFAAVAGGSAGFLLNRASQNQPEDKIYSGSDAGIPLSLEGFQDVVKHNQRDGSTDWDAIEKMGVFTLTGVNLKKTGNQPDLLIYTSRSPDRETYTGIEYRISDGTNNSFLLRSFLLAEPAVFTQTVYGLPSQKNNYPNTSICGWITTNYASINQKTGTYEKIFVIQGLSR